MQQEQQLRFGPYRLDLRTLQLWRGTLEVKLTPKALSVLHILVTRPGQVVTKDEFFQSVWAETVVSDDALSACIQELRRALRDDARNPRYIETAHRRGYRFLPPVTTQPVPSAKLQVASQEEVVSSQYSVASSQQEGSQEAKDREAEGVRLQAEGSSPPSPSSLSPLSSLDKAQRNPGEERRQADGLRLKAEGLPRFSLPTRFWSSKAPILAAVLLLAGTVLTTHYLLRPTLITYHSSLVTQEAQPPSLPLPNKPSLAVMPFTNMSGDPEQEYFSDGLTDDLITDLSRLSGLFVIARHSVFTYKGRAVKVQEISKELGVRYVLEGSVRKTEDQVRINAQLVDATTGHHLWAERYDQPLKDVFTLQDEIVQKIVTTLRLQLTLQEHGYIARKRTANLEAYDAFLRGLEYFWRLTKATNVQAQQMFEKAIALDPQYAEAYAQLGWTYYMEWVWQWNVDPQTRERAFELAQQTVVLDDTLPGAHSLLGKVYAQKGQYDQAIPEGERAIALDPNNADSYAFQAEVLNFAGRSAEALQMTEQAMRLNPRYPPWYLVELGWAYQGAGQHAEAIAAYKQLLVYNPNFLAAYPNLAWGYLAQWAFQLSSDPQTLGQALEAARRAVALNDSFAWAHMVLGYVYLWQKQYEPVIAEMGRAIALDPNGANGYASLAEALSRVGRSEEALRAAEQALRRKPAAADNHFSFIGVAYYLAGQPEAGIAPLKQFLTRYPNILGPHLNLAAAYSELGRTEEAQAEVAEVLRLNPKFSLEVYKERAPIKDPTVLERQLAALRKAGLK